MRPAALRSTPRQMDNFQQTFEQAWLNQHLRWCDRHDLKGAVAFSHPWAKITYFHRVAAATAVLTGAFLVGDSMQQSLRDLALDTATSAEDRRRAAGSWLWYSGALDRLDSADNGDDQMVRRFRVVRLGDASL